MGKVIVLLGFCTAGKSTIIRYFKNNYSVNILKTKDTDEEISKSGKYDGHIYNIYLSFYKDISQWNDSKYNNIGANAYIEKKEKEILEELTKECLGSHIPYLIALGPFVVTRKPEWGRFYNNIKPICYYLELTYKEAYEGLKKRRCDKKFDGIRNLKSFGCWDDGSITKYEKGRYKLLSPKKALENIKKTMFGKNGVCKVFSAYSDSERTFKARKIQEEIKKKNELYNSIKKDLFN